MEREEAILDDSKEVRDLKEMLKRVREAKTFCASKYVPFPSDLESNGTLEVEAVDGLLSMRRGDALCVHPDVAIETRPFDDAMVGLLGGRIDALASETEALFKKVIEAHKTLCEKCTYAAENGYSTIFVFNGTEITDCVKLRPGYTLCVPRGEIRK